MSENELGSRLKQEREIWYNKAPTLCLSCSTALPYSRRAGKFCNNACSASYSNRNRIRVRRTYGACSCGALLERRNNTFCDPCIAAKKHQRPKSTFETAKNDASRRKVLLRTQPHQCQICSIEDWQGQPVPLVMDHIDGDSGNSARENLRLICLNCDGLLPTFKNRNKGKGRHARRERYKEGKSF